MSEQALLADLERLIALLENSGKDFTLVSLPTDVNASISNLICRARLSLPPQSTVGELLVELYALKEKLLRDSEAVPPEATTPGPAVANPVTSKLLAMRAKVSSQRDDAVQKSPHPRARGPR